MRDGSLRAVSRSRRFDGPPSTNPAFAGPEADSASRSGSFQSCKCIERRCGAIGIRLTCLVYSNNLKYMSRFSFAALTSVAVTTLVSLISAADVNAQWVAGRDLLDFPLGLLAEAPALSERLPGGLWNPATSSLTPSTRAEF